MKSQLKSDSHKNLEAVSFSDIKIEDEFWSSRISAHKKNTLKACLDKCESTGRISNFAKAGKLLKGEFEGIYYNDSDVYKVIEGIAYSLINGPDQELERRADQIIDYIAAAQEKDGYLFSYFTLVNPDEKWTNMAKHEMYCGGHLIEAAIAYHQATHKTKLLTVACKLADHYDSVFGPEKRHWVPAHQEIELALVKLYRATGFEKYWQLAQWLLEERGHGHGKGDIWDRDDWGPAYCQDDKPVREMTDVTGHAVRAMYMYAGISDIAAITGDKDYIAALDRLWESVILRNMYVTGGIGPSKHNEGFTEDYDLPNESAYCETCASVGMVLWNHRMNLLHGDSKYVDVLERAMYNGSIAGVSLSGDKFFYVNPLASDGTHHRTEWFDTSCCPTQIARFIPSIGSYMYAYSNDEILVNLYIASTGTINVDGVSIKLIQSTGYPWDGKIKIDVEPSTPKKTDICLRFPGWCKSLSVSINGSEIGNPIIENGYVRLKREWTKGDTIELDLDMPVDRVYADEKIEADRGKVALQRGPIVYCLEEIDNNTERNQILLSQNARLFYEYRANMLGGVTVIKSVEPDSNAIYTFIPYCVWDNRKPGYMDVWIREKLREMPAELYRLK